MSSSPGWYSSEEQQEPSPPGWYSDPEVLNGMRWWDGAQWTSHRKHLPPPVNEPPTPPNPVLPPDNRQPENRALATSGAALVVDGAVGLGPKREGIGGAITSILGGIVLIIGGLFLSGLLLDPPKEDEIETKGNVVTVTLEHWYNSDREPMSGCSVAGNMVAQDGKTYDWSRDVDPGCEWHEGGEAHLVYHPDNPAETVRVDKSKSQSAPAIQFALQIFIPGLGALVFLQGLWLFILRAGSIIGGGLMIKRGLGTPRRKSTG